MVQDQPVPVAAVGVKPAGSVSVTVTVPVVEMFPPFEAVSVNEPVLPRTNEPVWAPVTVRSDAETVSTSVALLLLLMGSGTPAGAVTDALTLSEEPRVAALLTLAVTV
jgi:hypothetical protein